MTVATDMKKMGDALVTQGKATLSEVRKPLFAWLGANSVALAKGRQLPEAVQARVRELPARLGQLPQHARLLTEQVKPGELPAQARQVAGKAQKQAEEVASVVTGRVLSTYAELVDRGEGLVATARRRPATKEAEQHAKTAKSRAKAAGTSAGKAAKATGASARATADEASK